MKAWKCSVIFISKTGVKSKPKYYNTLREAKDDAEYMERKGYKYIIKKLLEYEL